MKRLFSVLMAACALAASAVVSAQSVSYAPSNVPANNFNIYPFGSPTFSFAEMIPASYWSQTDNKVMDLAFWPSASSSFNCTTFFMGIGHVATPQPCPFNFPIPGTTNIGSFLDFTPIWDTATQGPFTWPLVANTWSPMGFAAAGGTNFVWDGVHDVAFFVTFLNATGYVATGFQQSTVTYPTRSYTQSYAAAQAQACNAFAGIYTELILAPAANAFTATTSGSGIGDLNLALTLIPAAAVEGYVLVSGTATGPVGSGGLLGINPDGYTFAFIQTPLGVGNPLHFPIGIPGVFPDQPFILGPGALALSGQTWDAVVVTFGPNYTYLGRSQVRRLVW